MAQPSPPRPLPATSREVFNPGDRREQSVLDEELLPGGSRFQAGSLIFCCFFHLRRCSRDAGGAARQIWSTGRGASSGWSYLAPLAGTYSFEFGQDELTCNFFFTRFRLVDLNAAPDEETEESGSNEPTVGVWAEAVHGHATSSLRCQRPRLPPMRDEQETSIQTSALEKALQNFARRRQELVVLPTVGMTIVSMAEA